ncbi:MAG: 7-carboxy-7-deazaguanine synthase QueE [Methanobrevibacter sp.]|jgi:organic radical activating enzyme|nr:7-carboxy-7-deazaguanine synthase QueE [Methanobrevibacter sp.]
MKAPIVEIFSSFQGEGLLIGRRQIFVRFAGCNLDCSYCDTAKSKSTEYGTQLSVEEIINKIEELKTPDLHSISFTGGEPLLYVDIINEIMKRLNFKFLLETNGTLPDSLSNLNNMDYVSLDIKLPEHFNNVKHDLTQDNDFKKYDIFENEIKSLKILIEWDTNIYCKIVVLPSTKLDTIKNIVKRLSNEIPEDIEIPIVIQPSSPLNQWQNHKNKLFEFSELIGKYNSVFLIPQVHKILDIE